MPGGKTVWGIGLPLALAGGEAGHAAGNVLLGFPYGSSGEFLQRSGAGAAHLTILVFAVGFVLVAAFAARAALGGGSSRATAAAALIPPLLYVVQEQLEAVAHAGIPDPTLFIDARFLLGLLIQLPFSALGYLVARALVRLADRIHAAIRAGRSPVAARRPVAAVPPTIAARAAARCGAHAVRGPPDAAVISA